MTAFTAFSAPYNNKEIPSEHNVHTLGPFAAAGLAAATPLLVLDRECSIESITARAVTPGTGTLQLVACGSGVTIASGTTITGAVNLASGLGQNVTTNLPMTAGAGNHLAAGTLIAVIPTSVSSTAGLVLTVRTRNRNYRVTDGGLKQFFEPPQT